MPEDLSCGFIDAARIMKKALLFTLLGSLLALGTAHADTSKDFVRVACVPEAGLFDVEVRTLHDSVAGFQTQHDRNAVLAAAGFHDPHRLKFSCDLGGIRYAVAAQQDETSERMCGGQPEIYVTVTRNDEKLLSNVVFGESCNGLPSVTKFTVGDGPKSLRGRETQVCYANGKENDLPVCDWTFGDAAGFGKRFPVDEDRIRNIVTRQERR